MVPDGAGLFAHPRGPGVSKLTTVLLVVFAQLEQLFLWIS